MRRSWSGYDFFAKCVFVSLLLLLASSASASNSDEETELLFARKAFADNFYDIAQGRLENFLKAYPQSSDLFEAHALLGKCYYFQGNLSKALYEFDIVLNAPAGSKLRDEALYWTGEIYLKNGEFKKSLELYQKVLDDYPSSSYVSYAVYSMGWAYYKLGIFDEAIKYFREVAVKYPYEKTAMESQFKIGECEYLAGKYENAQTELIKFVEKYPLSEKTPEAHYLAGEAYFYQAKYREAIIYFERALSITPEAKWASFARYRLGGSFYQLGEYGRSVEEFKKCVMLCGDNIFLKSASLLGLVLDYEKIGSSKDALAGCDEIITKFPDGAAAPEAYYRKVKLLYKEGRYAEAEEVCKAAMEKFPSSPYIDDLHYELGWVYVMQGKKDDAIGEFIWIEKESKDINLSSSALCKIGDIYLDRGEYKKASETYDIVLDKYSDSFWADYAQYQIGTAFSYSGKYDKAIFAYESVLVNFPNTGLKEKIIFDLGMAYFKREDFEHSFQEFRRFLQEFPQSGRAQQAKLFLANSYYNLGRYDEALALFKELSGSTVQDEIKVPAQYQLGWCYFNMHKEPEAVAEFNRFLSEHQGSPMAVDVKFWFADFYRSRNEYGKAKEYYLSIIALPSSDGIAEEALYRLGLTLQAEGKSGEAVERFEELGAKYPDTELAKSAFRKIAKIKRDGKDLDAAIEYLRKVITTNNTDFNAQVQYEMAECYEEKGDLVRAVEEYLKVPYLYSKGTFWSVRAQLKCAKVFERLGKLDEALKLYEKLADMDIEESQFARQRIEWIRWKGEKKDQRP